VQISTKLLQIIFWIVIKINRVASNYAHPTFSHAARIDPHRIAGIATAMLFPASTGVATPLAQ